MKKGKKEHVVCAACGTTALTDQHIPDGWYTFAGPREGAQPVEVPGRGLVEVPRWRKQGALCGACGDRLTSPKLTVLQGGKP